MPRPFLDLSKVLLEEYVCNKAETREKHLKGTKNHLKEENKISNEGKRPPSPTCGKEITYFQV